MGIAADGEISDEAAEVDNGRLQPSSNDPVAAPGWTPPVYNFDKWSSDSRTTPASSVAPAVRTSQAGDDTEHPKQERKGGPVLWRQALWSPDGTHILLHRSDHGFDLFSYLYEADVRPEAAETHTQERRVLRRTLQYFTPTPLLSLAWYPFARVNDAATWCIAVGARDVPIKLIDAYTGSTRASYGIMDHVERFVGPQALVFSSDGTRLYAGAPSAIVLISVADPGLNQHLLYKLPLQRGQVSSLAVTLTYDADGSPQQELLAVGTFEGNTGVYTLPLIGDLKSLYKSIRCVAGWKEPGHGVMHLLFHPRNPSLLFSTSRLTGPSNPIIAYDLRYPNQHPTFHEAYVTASSGETPSILPPSDTRAVCAILVRPTSPEKTSISPSAGNTHQRLHFAIEWSGHWLVAGSVGGGVGAWHLEGAPFTGEVNVAHEERAQEQNSVRDVLLRPTWSSFPHTDAVPNAMLHPSLPLLLSVSGARHWNDNEEEASDADEEQSNIGLPTCTTHDARLCVWDLSTESPS